jgi:hypothetical protein
MRVLVTHSVNSVKRYKEVKLHLERNANQNDYTKVSIGKTTNYASVWTAFHSQSANKIHLNSGRRTDHAGPLFDIKKPSLVPSVKEHPVRITSLSACGNTLIPASFHKTVRACDDWQKAPVSTIGPHAPSNTALWDLRALATAVQTARNQPKHRRYADLRHAREGAARRGTPIRNEVLLDEFGPHRLDQ